MLPRLPRDLYPRAAKQIELLREAAADGLGEAQTFLGYYYQHGFGELQEDDATAGGWYKAAADNPEAGHTGYAALHYAHIQRINNNPDEAIKYYRQAAAQGDLGGFYQQDALFALALALSTHAVGFTNDPGELVLMYTAGW